MGTGIKVEVIDIESSAEEEESNCTNPTNNRGLANQVEETKPSVVLTTAEILGPTQLLEARRKKIDELLEYYGDTHNRLLSLQPFMNLSQKAQWQRLLSLKQRQFLPELHEEPQPEPESHSSNRSLSDLRNEYALERSRVAAQIKRVSQVRRFKRKKRVRKRSSPTKTYTARKTTTARKAATTSTVKSSTYTPRISIKTEQKPSRSALFAHVKKEK